MSNVLNELRAYVPSRCKASDDELKVAVNDAMKWIENKLGSEADRVFDESEDSRAALFYIVTLLVVAVMDQMPNHRDIRFAAANHMLAHYLARTEVAA